MMDEENNFRELFQFLIDQYRLRPEIAERLLHRILFILEKDTFRKQLYADETESKRNEVSDK